MKKLKKTLFMLIIFLMSAFTFIFKANAKEVNVYIFYGKTCPHCKAADAYLNDIKDKYNLNIYEYEVWENKDNLSLLKKVSNYTKKEAKSVPYVVINNTAIIGYSEGFTDETYRYNIKKASDDSFDDKIADIIGVKKPEVKTTTITSKSPETTKKEEQDIIQKLPLIGKVNLKNISLPVVSLVLGLVDGFNPCAMWILLFLISTLIGMKDKKRLWILGITFLVSSSLVYLFFMLSWLSFAKMISGVVFVRFIIALVALIGGTINLISYVKSLTDEDGCNVVDDKKRIKIFDKIKKFTHEKSFVLAIVGIIILAASVNLIELACSAGIPIIYTQILAMNNLSAIQYVVYILIYILFFMLDDLIIFIIAIKTFELTGISNKYSKYSHLIGGILMILIGVLLVLKPEWLMFNF